MRFAAWQLDGGTAHPAAPSSRAALVLALGVGVGVLGVAHAALLWALDGLPYQDVPNHLARAVISADLLFDGGRRFGDAYELRPGLAPYVLHDLALTVLVDLLGPYAGARVFTIAVAASLPVAVAVYLRALGHGAYAVLLGALLGLYLGTDWTFLMGFQAFRLSLALTLLALAAWQVHLRTGSARSFAAYSACLAAGYLTHAAALLFVGAGAAAAAALALGRRTTTISRAVSGALPLLAIAAWQVASAGVAPDGATVWEPARVKLRRVASPFRRFDRGTDAALLLLLGAAVAALCAAGRRAWRSARVTTPAALALLFLLLYAAMPVARGYVWYIDVRALPLAALFTVFAALAAAEQAGRRSAAAAALALALAAGNLWSLRAHLTAESDENLAYRAVAAQVPAGAAVLTIATRPRQRTVDPLRHAGQFATIERGARTPYLFSGGVTPHFRTRHPLAAPHESWYLWGVAAPDAAEVAGTYDFILLARPYDPGRLPVRTRVVVQNGTAALLEVVR